MLGEALAEPVGEISLVVEAENWTLGDPEPPLGEAVPQRFPAKVAVPPPLSSPPPGPLGVGEEQGEGLGVGEKVAEAHRVEVRVEDTDRVVVAEAE